MGRTGQGLAGKILYFPDGRNGCRRAVPAQYYHSNHQKKQLCLAGPEAAAQLARRVAGRCLYWFRPGSSQYHEAGSQAVFQKRPLATRATHRVFEYNRLQLPPLPGRGVTSHVKPALPGILTRSPTGRRPKASAPGTPAAGNIFSIPAISMSSTGLSNC